MSLASANAFGVILPDAVYTRQGMKSAATLCESKLREAKRSGLEPRRFWVGKKCYYRGRDIITFLEAFSALELRRSVLVEG